MKTNVDPTSSQIELELIRNSPKEKILQYANELLVKLHYSITVHGSRLGLGQYWIPFKAQKARALGLAPQGALRLRGPH